MEEYLPYLKRYANRVVFLLVFFVDLFIGQTSVTLLGIIRNWYLRYFILYK